MKHQKLGQFNDKLTLAQERVYHYIRDLIEDRGIPPSYAEIAEAFNFSSDGTVRTYLEHLERKGYISRSGKARCIKLLHFPRGKAIPIIGEIAAGSPILAVENYIGTLSDISELKFREGRFALKIKGDSMRDAGIIDGDLAIIQKGLEVFNGQIAGVLLDSDEATLKRIYYDKNSVRLQPENPAYQPIILTKDSFHASFIGRMIALVRKCSIQ
ncbi:transcriptional repressor LexA [Thermoproteota archaeon]